MNNPPYEYRPDRIPDEAKSAYEGVGGKTLQSATNLCLRCHRAVPKDKVPEYAHLPSHADRNAGRNAVSKFVRPLEREVLRNWAAKNGLLVNDAAFTAKWLAGGKLGEAENQVYFDEKSQRWFKRNTMAYHSTYLEFFHRVALHNFYYPEAPLRLDGFAEHDGELMPIISQPHVRAERGATQAEVEEHMRGFGFVREKGTGDGNDYYNPQSGIRIEDLHDENVLVGEDGELFFIDPVAYLDDRGKLKRLHSIGEGRTLADALLAQTPAR